MAGAPPKSLSPAERGHLGAVRRWSDKPTRTVSLANVPPETARLVRSLVAAARTRPDPAE